MSPLDKIIEMHVKCTDTDAHDGYPCHRPVCVKCLEDYPCVTLQMAKEAQSEMNDLADDVVSIVQRLQNVCRMPGSSNSIHWNSGWIEAMYTVLCVIEGGNDE